MDQAPDLNLSSYDRCNIQGFSLLKELSLNLHWSWSHRSDPLWEALSPKLWELTRNPWAVIQTTSREKLEKLLSDEKFYSLAKELAEKHRHEETTEGWFRQHHKDSPLKSIAYFSMEFMLAEALPIYSGGLGNVAGDTLKAASDLDVPIIGIGLLYQQGYFRQVLDSNGNQQALYPYNDPGQLPITPLRTTDGEWLRLEIPMPGFSLFLRAWQVQVGRVRLLLLDSNDIANFPAYRGITAELYGGGSELRLQQEMILGIGGYRLLDTLGIEPTVCHLNEGHAAFMVLERAYVYMQKHQVDFDTALKITRAGNLFTTHTAVPAGFDHFSKELLEKYLDRYAKNKLKIPFDKLLSLGRANGNDDNEPFNMAFLALHGSAYANGVSALHEKVSRDLFAPLFPRRPENEVPIGHVTNGVHVPSWDSPSSDILWGNACGECRWQEDPKELGAKIAQLGDEKLWTMRKSARTSLVEFARKRVALQLSLSGATSDEIEFASKIFDPNVLTLGFARRFATYKRPNLLLHDPERLIAILTNPIYPVQLVLAGKAHPADLQGQALIAEWSHFIKRPEVRSHVAFISDYNMVVAQEIVQGVDVWINTPLRPWEACGTSGMKVLVNGGLNLSVPDGWWAEAYCPEVGWAIGCNGDSSDEDEKVRDADDANALYTLLEKEVIPNFYDRNSEGTSTAWTDRMRASMSKLTAHFSSNRMVREYTEKYYLPAAELYHNRQKSSESIKIQQLFEKCWNQIRFGDVKVNEVDNHYHFEVELALHSIDPSYVAVEIYLNSAEGREPQRYPMAIVRKLEESTNSYLYAAEIAKVFPACFYTARVVPASTKVEATPLELPYILWQH